MNVIRYWKTLSRLFKFRFIISMTIYIYILIAIFGMYSEMLVSQGFTQNVSMISAILFMVIFFMSMRESKILATYKTLNPPPKKEKIIKKNGGNGGKKLYK